ncbi:MAG: photosynthetic complex assembly protein PuhC [Steroidobacteraceae bacterium]
MSDAADNRSPPGSLLLGIGVLLVGAMLLVVLARSGSVQGLAPESTVPDAASARISAAIELRFSDREDGAVVVQRAADGSEVAVLGESGSGFVRGVLRGLARDRRMRGIDAVPPFELVRWSDGRLTLRDTATDRLIDLGAFGPTNLQAFANLLAMAERP